MNNMYHKILQTSTLLRGGKTLLLFMALLLSVSSCRVFDNYERPQNLSIDGIYRDTAQANAALAVADTLSFGNQPWQQVFTDPLLQALIRKALTQNVNMVEADQLILQAEQGLKVARMAYLPQLTLSAQGTLSSWDFGKASQIYNIPLNASWQIGSLGSLRNSKKQVEMSLLQTKAAKQAVQTGIISTVANLYYSILMLDEQLRTTQSTISLWEENVKTMEAMAEVGYTNQAAVAQARANLIEIRASLPALQESIRKSENALCVLLHEAPHAIERSSSFNPTFPSSLSVGVPLQLLSSRPDVKMAELQLANAFYGVQKANADFYPQISINGTAGWTNNGGMGITNPGKILANAVGSIVQPLFMRGQLTAQKKIAESQQKIAALDFEQTLLTAGQEVSDALTAYQSSISQSQLREQEVEQLKVALEKTQDLFKYTNTTTYLETLTAQQSLLSAQLKLINDKYSQTQAVINLYKALGGGREN